jgi:hypothetical protein
MEGWTALLKVKPIHIFPLLLLVVSDPLKQTMVTPLLAVSQLLSGQYQVGFSVLPTKGKGKFVPVLN